MVCIALLAKTLSDANIVDWMKNVVCYDPSTFIGTDR